MQKESADFYLLPPPPPPQPPPPPLDCTNLPEPLWQIYCAQATLCHPSSAAKHVAVNDLPLVGVHISGSQRVFLSPRPAFTFSRRRFAVKYRQPPTTIVTLCSPPIVLRSRLQTQPRTQRFFKVLWDKSRVLGSNALPTGRMRPTSSYIYVTLTLALF